MLKDIFYGTILIILVVTLIGFTGAVIYAAWDVILIMAAVVLGFYLIEKCLKHFGIIRRI